MIRLKLTLAAESLAQGQFIPAWLYRWLGGIGWRQQAKRWGAQQDLMHKPYQVTS